IEELTRAGPIHVSLLDLLESVPVSYVVVRNQLVAPERRHDFESFLARAVNTNRLRFVLRSREGDDLYAVLGTEPDARQEAPLPFAHASRDWASLLAEDPVYLLGQYEAWSLSVLRFYVASYGRLPRMEELLPDVRAVASGVAAGVAGEESKLEVNMDEFARGWVARKSFAREFEGAGDEQYVERLFANARLAPRTGELDAIVAALKEGSETRASVLRRVVGREEFARAEWPRGFVLLHYFGYLRRDPGDPPDRDLSGFDFWVRELQTTGDPARVTKGFMNSYEYDGVRRKQ
ncbi:MAG TPA: hypothetical protein VGV38_16075, partial [Pyrinomonadaceae bacterium]|nr:hypothetical protein [Pyrinomonadaceae bacterium]